MFAQFLAPNDTFFTLNNQILSKGLDLLQIIYWGCRLQQVLRAHTELENGSGQIIVFRKGWIIFWFVR